VTTASSLTAPSGSAQPRFSWAFLALFAAIYCGLYFGYSAIPDRVLRDEVYFYGLVCPARAVINWIAPAEQVAGTENRLESGAARLNIVRGCDGSGLVFLLVAAVIAYRARFKSTVFGILGAIALVYVLNQMRIIALYFLNSHRPEWFLPMHVYFIPTLMILVSAIYFAIWSGRLPHGYQPSDQA
jgi:exosortase family protein XrtM